MIITKTPFRISLFGGGTDYPDWYKHNGGAVLTTSIDKYCYISVRYLPPFFDHNYRISWSKIENVKFLEEIEHRSVRACLQYLGINRGVEVHHWGDLPARAGLGSSSAFTVGMLQGLQSLRGKYSSKRTLADNAIQVEQKVLGETVGIQDQIECAFGGINQIVISPSGEYDVRPVFLKYDRMIELQSHLMLFFTGFQRFASDIAAVQIEGMKNHTLQLQTMQAMVGHAIESLQGDTPIEHIGDLLNAAWLFKRSVSPLVSTPAIDNIYLRARAAGAIGGKLLGAGSGGFMLIFASPEKQKAVRAMLSDLVEVPVRFEFSGSQIIFAAQE